MMATVSVPVRAGTGDDGWLARRPVGGALDPALDGARHVYLYRCIGEE
jgi:hypothetical protein